MTEANDKVISSDDLELMLGGRPFKFQDPEELETRMTEYFLSHPIDKWTVTGLSLALDCDRDTLLNYEKNKQGQHENVSPAVIRLIKRAKLMIHNSYELSLREKGRTADIFALKNFGWVDKIEQDVTSGGDKIQSVTGFIYNKPDDAGTNQSNS